MQVYAPTNDSRSEVNKHFYNELQKVTVKVGRRDIVMGVLNARVGTDSEKWGSVIGRHAEEVRNEGWELLLRLLRFCAVNEMLVANTRGYTSKHGCVRAEN